ncbi:MAG: dihydrodipicolinate synthase family protein [Acidobacteriota bacterium]|nr:dihydrodipicolinate synthase family protein [Acidobacteriota bacterium]
MKRQGEIDVRESSSESSLSERLRGVLLPFTTPFGANGEVDAPALGANIERWNGTGVAGYVALGSTGERAHLDERERMLVVEAARARVPRSLAFVVGVGEQSTRGSISEARRAASAGADALLVLTPHFYRAGMSQDALAEHFNAVADASRVPVILYNIPQNTGVAVAPETVARLSEHTNIAGIKDSSGDLVNFAEMLRLAGGCREDFALLVGHAGVFYASLCAGACGGILAVGCCAPRLCVRIYEAFRAGDHALALELQWRLAPLARAVTTRFGIGGLKAALDLAGYAGGPVRAPLRAPGTEARAEIARLLEEAEGR